MVDVTLTRSVQFSCSHWVMNKSGAHSCIACWESCFVSSSWKCGKLLVCDALCFQWFSVCSAASACWVMLALCFTQQWWRPYALWRKVFLFTQTSSNMLSCSPVALQVCWLELWTWFWTPVPEWLRTGSCCRRRTLRSTGTSPAVCGVTVVHFAVCHVVFLRVLFCLVFVFSLEPFIDPEKTTEIKTLTQRQCGQQVTSKSYNNFQTINILMIRDNMLEEHNKIWKHHS